MKDLFKNINFSLKTVILTVILSLLFFLIGLTRIKTYQSDVTILVIPKSENATRQRSQILNNIIQLPKSLAFYDRLLQDNPSFEDSSADEKPEKRKQIWNEMISVKQNDTNTSMILFTISTSGEKGADIIASKTVRTIFDVTSAYYNVKDDVDLRIIDGPITKTVYPGWPWTLLFSIILGGIISMLLRKFSFLKKKSTGFQDIFKNNPLRNLNLAKNETDPMPIEKLEDLYQQDSAQEIFTEKSLPKVSEETTRPLETKPEVQNKPTVKEVQHLQEIANRGVYPNFPEMPVHNIGENATAPANLPIGDFDLTFDLENEDFSISKEAFKEEAPVEEKTHEPNAQQLKERLNQLLKGEI